MLTPGKLPEQAGGSEGGARPPAALAAAASVTLLPGTAARDQLTPLQQKLPLVKLISKLKNTKRDSYGK